MFGRLQADDRNGYYLIGEAGELRQMPEYGNYFDGHAAVVPADVPERRATRLARLASHTHQRSELNRMPKPSWLVDGVMTRASLTLLSGKFGTYKSFVAVALAASVGTGVPFLGHPVSEQGPVIYIAAEGASGMGPRFGAWETAHTAGIMIPDDRLSVIGTAVQILNPADMHALRVLCRHVCPRLIVWDTLHRCAPGVDENSSQESGRVVEALANLREEFECTQLVCHHTGHSGTRARGSSSWEDDFDNSWVIKLAGEGEDRSPANQRTMEHRKVKDGELSKKIDIGLTPASDSAYVDRQTVQAPRSWLVVQAYAARLDEAGVPLTHGRVRVIAALKELGVQHIDNNVANSVSVLRRGSDYIPSTKPSADV